MSRAVELPEVLELMERLLGLRPWSLLCVLVSVCAVAGCGTGDDPAPAVAGDGGSDAATADGAEEPLLPDDFCEPQGRPCPAGSTCRRQAGARYAHCRADGAEFGACRPWPGACDPGLLCYAPGECRQAPPWPTPAPEDAGVGADAAAMTGCSRYSPGSCPSGMVCVYEGSRDRCVTAGTEGRPCRTGGACDDGLVCTSTSGGTCRAPLVVGAACDAYYDAPCPSGSACLYLSSGGGGRRCIADGTRDGRCGPTLTPCASGLRCSTGYTPRCQPTVEPGAACDYAQTTNVCTEGARCLSGVRGYRCVADGAEGGVCVGSDATCGEGLRCDGSRCRRAVAVGDPCGPLVTDGLCPEASSCEGSEGARRCVARGVEGGRCRSTSPRCDDRLECGLIGPYEDGVCRRVVSEGGACDVASRSAVCAGASSCAPDLSGVTGTCALAGTMAGALCRETSPRCDASLECSLGASATGTCRRVEPTAAACDVAGRAVVCAGTARCVRLDGAGICTTATAETEPNDGPGGAQVVDGNPVHVPGTVARGTSDCFAVTVPAGASLLAIDEPVRYDDYLTSGVTLHDAAGALVTSGTGTTPTIDPLRDPLARGLVAGRYVVCVNATASFDGEYRLSIAVTAPAPREPTRP